MFRMINLAEVDRMDIMRVNSARLMFVQGRLRQANNWEEVCEFIPNIEDRRLVLAQSRHCQRSYQAALGDLEFMIEQDYRFAPSRQLHQRREQRIIDQMVERGVTPGQPVPYHPTRLIAENGK